MLEQMKNDLDKLNDMLKKSEGKNYYRKEKAKVICKIIAPFVGFTGLFSSLYILTIGVPFMKHNTKAYLNKETTTYDDNTKSVYEYYQKKQSIKPMLYIYGTWVKESDHNEFNYVLESNDVALVKRVCYILAVLISSLCVFAYNESKIEKYKKL